MMGDPTNPLGSDIWRRGSLLGLAWLAVFVVMTGVSYALLGALGWDGTGRALCAMGLGPAAGMALIALWWAVRRPTLVPPAGDKVGAGTDRGGEDG
ncbi:MAG: hypothetical protein OZ934_03095 [Anaerolineae bacterium]|nr:hypothetical protein [Anaerolineae bacterium]